MNITGTIKNARLRGTLPDDAYLSGNLFDDTRKRFADGDYIHTSRIVEVLPDSVYRTLHSTYKVELPQ